MSTIMKGIGARSAGLGVGTFAVGLAALAVVFTAFSTHHLNVDEQLTAALVLVSVTATLCAACGVLMTWHKRTEKDTVRQAKQTRDSAGADAGAFTVFVHRLSLGVRQRHLQTASALLLVAVVLFLDAKEHDGASASEILQHIYDRVHAEALASNTTASFSGFSDFSENDLELFQAESERVDAGCLDMGVVLRAEVVALAAIGVAGILLAGETAASLAEALVLATLGRVPACRKGALSSRAAGVVQSLIGIVSLGMVAASVVIILDTDRLPGSHMGWQAGAWGLAGLLGAVWLLLVLHEPNYSEISSILLENDLGDDDEQVSGPVEQEAPSPEALIERAATLRDSQHLFLVSLVGAGMITSIAHGSAKAWNPAAILLPVLVGMLGAQAGSRMLATWAARAGLFRPSPAPFKAVDLPKNKDVSALGMFGAWLVFCLIAMSGVALVATVASLVGWLSIQHRDYYWIPASLGGVALLTLAVTVTRAVMLRATNKANASAYGVLTNVAGSALGIVIGTGLTCVAFETAWRLDPDSAEHAAREHAAVVQGVFILLLAALSGPYNLFDDVKMAIMPRFDEAKAK
jgi:hypothetical protein